jgi:hypothetical protein
MSEMTALGVTGLLLVVVQHPLGGERPESVVRRAHQVVEQLASALGSARRGALDPAPVRPTPA